MDLFALLDEAAPLGRAMVRNGDRPSQVVAKMTPWFEARGRWVNSILLVAFARQTFHLTIVECKNAPGYGNSGITDVESFDRYFIEIINRNRALWDTD